MHFCVLPHFFNRLFCVGNIHSLFSICRCKFNDYITVSLIAFTPCSQTGMLWAAR